MKNFYVEVTPGFKSTNIKVKPKGYEMLHLRVMDSGQVRFELEPNSPSKRPANHKLEPSDDNQFYETRQYVEISNAAGVNDCIFIEIKKLGFCHYGFWITKAGLFIPKQAPYDEFQLAKEDQ